MYLNWLYRVRKDTTRKPHRFESPQPFKDYNYKVTVMTASDGYNYEFYDQEDTTRIGTVVINRLTRRIVKFVNVTKDDFPDEVISRMYDPYVGRFWQIDPLADEFHDLSPYNFVENNPINNIDPDGMAPIGVNDDSPNTIASTFIRPDGTIIEHRDDNDFGIYIVTDEAAWTAGGRTSNGLAMVGIENRAYPYIPGQKINLMDKNQNWLAPSPGNINPDFTLESLGIPLFGWLKALRWGKVGIAANRLHHIFGKSEHQLGSLLAKFGGSQEKAFLAVEKAANEALKAGKLTANSSGILPKVGEVLNVGGVEVRLIGGKVENGIVTISSFSRKGL